MVLRAECNFAFCFIALATISSHVVLNRTNFVPAVFAIGNNHAENMLGLHGSRAKQYKCRAKHISTQHHALTCTIHAILQPPLHTVTSTNHTTAELKQPSVDTLL